jgi:monothiol glutaredoxin
MNESLRHQISQLVADNRVVLFMKGTRRMPQCGFSAQVVKILDELLPSYETVDVLASQEMREGVKEYSQWPTIPQLYIGGQFVGGCDIVRDLNASGELEKMLGVKAAEVPTPTITISPGAQKAFEAALTDAAGESLHLRVSAQFEYDLYFGPREAGELEVATNTLPLLLDRSSMRLANGMSIDFIQGPGGGFKIENPNGPPRVKALPVEAAKAMLDRGELTIYDVRPDGERSIASVASSRAFDAAGQEHLMSLDRDAPVAFICHTGRRSQAVADQVIRQGFKKVYNVAGGIDAWSARVDPSIPRY